MIGSLAGSSPLARGRQVRGRVHAATRRLIPAGAGATSSPTPARKRRAAHPRWRGGDVGWISTTLAPIGSSPLARGRHQMGAASRRTVRLIPAGAGATSHAAAFRASATAHPRWRGGDTTGYQRPFSSHGSSPLARGRPAMRATPRSMRRLIPAGAGATISATAPGERSAAHPRWRGGDSLQPFHASAVIGSSPLARGRHFPIWGFSRVSLHYPTVCWIGRREKMPMMDCGSAESPVRRSIRYEGEHSSFRSVVSSA